ncbi:hypothetical protein GOV14_03035 [Candidatus Pacearchaeota archaeon]|nr:hypothetical protein [Candidatus Pacearchaeota archaeon]
MKNAINLNTIGDLERAFGVETGDIVMCTYDPSPNMAERSLEISSGIYNPYQGLASDKKGDLSPALRTSTVDLAANATQRVDLLKSEHYYRLHLTGQGSGDFSRIKNPPSSKVQIKVKDTINFEILKKASGVTRLFRDSI